MTFKTILSKISQKRIFDSYNMLKARIFDRRVNFQKKKKKSSTFKKYFALYLESKTKRHPSNF